MDYVLGVDVGTSSCKATLISPNGEAFATSSDDYPLVTPQPDWAEQTRLDGVAEWLSPSLASWVPRARLRARLRRLD